jgi:hypothetical protein
LPEPDAVAATLQLAQPRDLVFIFADEINDVWQQITSFGGHKAADSNSTVD